MRDFYDFATPDEMLSLSVEAMTDACPHLMNHASPKADKSDLERISQKLRLDKFYEPMRCGKTLAQRLPIWC